MTVTVSSFLICTVDRSPLTICSASWGEHTKGDCAGLFCARKKPVCGIRPRPYLCRGRGWDHRPPDGGNMNTAFADVTAEGVEPHRKRYRAKTTHSVPYDGSVFPVLCVAHPSRRRRDRTQISYTLYTIPPRLSTFFFGFR